MDCRGGKKRNVASVVIFGVYQEERLESGEFKIRVGRKFILIPTLSSDRRDDEPRSREAIIDISPGRSRKVHGESRIRGRSNTRGLPATQTSSAWLTCRGLNLANHHPSLYRLLWPRFLAKPRQFPYRETARAPIRIPLRTEKTEGSE